jgi:hypothetical protein
LKTKLNGGNTIKAINTWAVPVIRYTAGIIEWTQEEVENLDRKTRKLMTANKAFHPKSDPEKEEEEKDPWQNTSTSAKNQP